MENVINELNRLIQLDIDASLAYSQALENIDIPTVHSAITRFRADHERHIRDLTAEVRNLGGEPVERKRDLKGFFIESFTAIRSKTGTAGALKAMRMNEGLTNSAYEAALNSEFPQRVMSVVQKNREDERRHLEYIDRTIEEEPWETESRQAG